MVDGLIFHFEPKAELWWTIVMIHFLFNWHNLRWIFRRKYISQHIRWECDLACEYFVCRHFSSTQGLKIQFFSCQQLRVGKRVPYGQVMEWCRLFQLKAHFAVSLACWMRPSMLTLPFILLMAPWVHTRQFFLQVRLFSRACSTAASRKRSPPQST